MKVNLVTAVLSVVTGLTLPFPVAGAAILDGSTIQVTYLFPNTSTVYAGPTDVTVAPGTQLLGFAGFVNITFSDANVTITTTRDAVVNNVAFDGLEFTDVNGTVPPVAITVNPATNYSGFTASRLTLTDRSLFVNLADLPGLRGQVLSLDVNRITVTPEPSTFGLLGAGLLALWRVRRRFS